MKEELRLNEDQRPTGEQPPVPQQHPSPGTGELSEASAAAFLLDPDLRIKAFNAGSRALFSLTDTDIGRPLEDVLSKLPPSSLRDDALVAHASGASLKREIQSVSGQFFIRAVRPDGPPGAGGRGTVVTLTESTKADHEMASSGQVHATPVGAVGHRAPRADPESQASHLLACAIQDMLQPLQSIKLLHGLLEQQIVSPLTRLTLARLGDAAEQMTDLARSLLDLHQVESGRVRFDMTSLPVDSLFAQLATAFAPLAHAKALDLRFVPSTAKVLGHRKLLSRILSHVLGHAIRYTEAGRILVGCRRAADAICIEVWSTGFGPNLMDRGSTGIGVGLHIIKRFADLLNYRLDVRPGPGGRTVLAVVLPLAPSLPPADDAVMAGARAYVPTVLVIDHDPTQLAAVSMSLQQDGYQVSRARNGAEALDQIRRGPEPTIVVAERNLSDGCTAAEVVLRLREDRQKNIPALVLGDRLQEAQGADEQAGDIFVLSRPLGIEALLSTVEAMVRRVVPGWSPSGTSRRSLVETPSMADPLSEIAIIDEDPGIRVALQSVLEGQGYKVETFPNAEVLLADPDRSRFQCLVADVVLPGMDGLALQARLKLEQRRPPIIFLTGVGDIPLAVRAMREGAADFLQKPVDHATLLGSIARAMEQDATSEPTPSQLGEVEARLALLTKREREILDRIVVGQLNKNIAFDLHISERTIEHHRQSIMRKMGVKSVAMLVRMIAEVERKRS